MKRTNLILAFVLLLLFCRTSFGQNQNDHLEPVNGIFSIYNFDFEYYSQVRKILFNGLSDNPEIRFVTLPSFGAENVLDIEFDSNSGKYYLIYHIVNENIWHAKDKSNLKVNEFKKSITKESVELFKKLFNSVVLKTKFTEDNRGGFDGTTYYFSVNNYGPKDGEIWSPDGKSKMGIFVKIAQKLITLTTSKNEIIKIDGEFKTEIKDLIESLK